MTKEGRDYKWVGGGGGEVGVGWHGTVGALGGEV